jgi:hypothetical protein
MGAKLPDEVWEIICDTLAKYDGVDCRLPELREYVEQNAEITLFDGGAFVAIGNEFDLFVVPQKQGKWNIRKEINNFLATMAKRHSTAIVKINTRNIKSLRLAKFFGFQACGKNQRGQIVLEKKLWAI